MRQVSLSIYLKIIIFLPVKSFSNQFLVYVSAEALIDVIWFDIECAQSCDAEVPEIWELEKMIVAQWSQIDKNSNFWRIPMILNCLIHPIGSKYSTAIHIYPHQKKIVQEVCISQADESKKFASFWGRYENTDFVIFVKI